MLRDAAIKRYKLERTLAVAMGCHKRLGESSPLHVSILLISISALCPEGIMMIVGFCFKAKISVSSILSEKLYVHTL